MRAFTAFFRKELMESVRSGKLLVLGILFVAFGIMNPAIAKLTPWIMDLMSDTLSQAGMTVTEVTVTAMDSWVQFFKNIPMALIVFILLYSSIFTKEYRSGTLVLMLTKGLARFKVVLAKSALLLILWTIGYWLNFGITYFYNDFYWDNSIAENLLPACVNWWLFGIFTVCVAVFFSVLCKGSSSVLLGTGGTVLAVYLLSLIPKLSHYTPASLMNSAALITGAEAPKEYLFAVVFTVLISIASLLAAISIMNKKSV